MTPSLRLDSVADITMGQAPPGESYNAVGDGLPLVAGAGDFGELHPAAKKFTNAPGKICASGDIILGIRATIGEKVIADRPYCLGRGVAGLRPREALVDRYLWHWLTHSAPTLAAKAKGATFKQVNREDISELRINLPPVPEQRRIAQILDTADALRAKRRVALDQLDALTQTIFMDMFARGFDGPAIDLTEKRLDLPEGWSWELLTDVARLATGHTPDRERSDYWNGQIPWISLTDIRELDGTVAERTTQYVTADGIENSSAVLLPPGTVCFSRTASVGFVTVMGREMATSQDFVNWVCGPKLDPTYLMWALLGSRRRLQAISSGSTHKTIYVRVVEQFRGLIPPIELQREFARRVATLDGIKAQSRASLAELVALFGSLQYSAFRGEP